MTSAKEIILEYVCPALGVIIGNFMFAAPVRDLKAAIDRGDLGPLNPTPWVFMLGNCMGWVLYGALLKNYWVFFGNAPGLLISIWLNMGAVKLLYQGYHVKEVRESTVAFLEKEKPRIQTNKDSSNETISTSSANEQKNTNAAAENQVTIDAPEDWATIMFRITSEVSPAPARHEGRVMFICIFWVIFGTILAFVDAMDLDAKIQMVGFATNCITVFFYAAPLSTIFQVLKEHHTASIHIPTMVMNTLNASFWCAYAIAISDLFIAVPNGLGAGFGGIQFFLVLTFPRSPKGKTETSDDDAEKKSDAQQSSPLTQKTLVSSSSQIHSYTRDVENNVDVASA